MATHITITDSFKQTIRSHRGDSAEEWLAELPAILDECFQNWSLTPGKPFAELSFTYVTTVTTKDGSAAVLKAGPPTDNDFLTEIAALRIFDGRGSARLLDADRKRGALLLERLEPGRMLSELADDEERTRITADVMQRLWRPAPAEHSFPAAASWGRGFERLRRRFDGGTGPLPSGLVEQAETLYRELLASQGEQMLLHGDLHHFNILSAARQPWLAIDPKGVIGEREYETGALIRNPIDELSNHPDLRRLTARRIDQLAEQLGFDRQRVHGWALAQAVLSAWWGIDDSNTADPFWIELAECIRSIRL